MNEFHHGNIAAETLHWYDNERQCWISQQKDGWVGWSAVDATPCTLVDYKPRPWVQDLDKSQAPFYQWFVGGLCNAAFNEIDRHVLNGFGSHTAFILEPPLSNLSGAGHCSYLELLLESSLASMALLKLGLKPYSSGGGGGGGSRIALIGPNTLDQVVWIQAAKRLGMPYTCLPEGASIETAVSRIRSLGAELVYYSGGSSSASQPTDSFLRALRKHCHVVVGGLITTRSGTLKGCQQCSHPPDGCLDAAELRDTILKLHPSYATMLHNQSTAVELIQFVWQVNPPVPVESNYPLFITYTSGSTGKPKGLVHSHGTMASVCHTLSYSFGVPPPLFSFTSTSTSTSTENLQTKGKTSHTLPEEEIIGSSRTSILPDASTYQQRDTDVILVVATPAWITGQSYMLSACLTAGVTSVLLEGSPVAPSATRFAHVIERHKVTVFKAGSTFLRQVMADPRAIAELQECDLSSVRAASFCAEPVSPTVHAFAIQYICKHYCNSYWASEHGAIVFSRKFLCHGAPPPADARCEPVPWVNARVMIADNDGKLQDVDEGERGEIVLGMRCPFPSLARTIWGDKGQFDQGSPKWRGNLNAFTNTYFCLGAGAAKKDTTNNKQTTDELLFVQGDFAQRHSDGSFSFHGRSDDVMNIGGQRIGTGEVEAALYKHKRIHGANSPLANCVVVGATDPMKGEIPIAFVVTVPGIPFDAITRVELQTLVIDTVGVLAAPAYFVVVSCLPQTKTGKYLRRMLRAIVNGASVSTSTDGKDEDAALVNPESLIEARAAVLLMQTKNTAANSSPDNTSIDSDDCVMQVRELLVQLALQASSWQDAKRNTNTILTGKRKEEDEAARPLNLTGKSTNLIDSSMPMHQPLMHLGFDSMRLVLFRDSILRQLPRTISPPILLMQLFGADGLESSTLFILATEITAAVMSARKQGTLMTHDWVLNNKDEDGWSTAALRKAKQRGADAGIILERDARDDKTVGKNGGLKPTGGIEKCFRGDFAGVKKLVIQHNWSAIYARCQQESTAVHWACTGGHLEIIQWLVTEVGCDVNAQNKVGRTPLMFAAKYGHCDCIRWMVEDAGANIHIRAADDSDVFAWAVFGANIPTLETVASLLSPTEIHRKNKFGCTAIHWAAAGGDVKVLKWLHARGLDFSLINDEKFSAVSKAAYHRHKEALEFLLLEKEGPQLGWQLRPVPSVDVTFNSLESLVEDSGLGSVHEFLAVNAGKVC